jgi:hypothetical protein
MNAKACHFIPPTQKVITVFHYGKSTASNGKGQ